MPNTYHPNDGPEATDEISRKLARLSTNREGGRALSPSSHLFSGRETRTDPAEYFWDGERRGGDPAHPYVVIQYTLGGLGVYEDADRTARQSPETAFFAVVPTAHRYYLPRGSSGWAFFFVIVRHPYAVSRLIQSVELAGPVHKLAIDNPVTTRLIRIFEATQSGQFRDDFDEEAAAVEFAIEFDRHAHHAVYPQSRRERLLGAVRVFAAGNMQGDVDVSTVATEFGMTRSGFSHHFKAVTGLAPASFIRQVRLEEAVQLLAHTDRKLESIASETGFASANDLCKVFRKHYHQSPTAYRRLATP